MRLTGSFAPIAPLCAALAFGQPARPTPAALPEALEGWAVPASVRLASDQRGNIAAWDHATGELALWSRIGKRQLDCLGKPLDPGKEPGLIAVNGNAALLTFMDHAAGSETSRVAAVVDLSRCEVKHIFSIEGLATQAVGTKHGWLVVASPGSTFSPDVTFRLLGDDGAVDGELDFRDEIDRFAREPPDLPGPGIHGARVFVIRNESWLIPNAIYELWRPAQHAKPFRRVEPPPCLAAKRIVLEGEENRRHVLDLIKTWDEKTRSRLEAALKEGKGQLGPSYLATTSDAAVYRSLVGVVVRDPVTPMASRLDIWDMMVEAVVAVLPFQPGSRLVALTEDGAWIRSEDGRMRKLPLPDLGTPLEDPCAALAVARDAPHSARAPAEPPASPPSEPASRR